MANSTSDLEPAENSRQPEAEVDALFLNRWSPRAFSNEPVPEEILKSLFEAARWAPSCYNEQPWLFLYATSAEDRARFLDILVEGNQAWAKEAPVLGFVLARRHFARNGKPNDWAVFDAGAAWMSLTIQARLHGLYTHGMAGFHRGKIYDALAIDKEKYIAVAAMAIGYMGDPSQLDDKYRKMEKPNGRKPLSEVAHEGGFR